MTKSLVNLIIEIEKTVLQKVLLNMITVACRSRIKYRNYAVIITNDDKKL